MMDRDSEAIVDFNKVLDLNGHFHSAFGDLQMAWIKLKEGAEARPEELTEFCKGKIAHYKVPKYFRFTTDFPMTVTGKIRKIEMRQISIKEFNLDAVNNIATV